MALVKCAYCGSQTVDKKSNDYTRYNDKNYHLKCAQLQKEKDDFFKYLCLVLGLKAPGPRIYSQANSFITKYHFTYAGMQRALYYLYEVKKHKDPYSIENKTIGLIPYCYEEAQNYFDRVEVKREQAETINKIAQANEKIINVKMVEGKKKTPTYNLDEVE